MSRSNGRQTYSKGFPFAFVRRNVDRRRFLRGWLLSLAGAVAGCLDVSRDGTGCGDHWPPDVAADEPTISPGASTTIGIDVAAATGLYLGRPSPDGVEFDVADASVLPAPDRTADLSPPKWYWDACTGVSVTVPVRVPEDADAGGYGYTVTAVRSRESQRDAVEAGFSIEVAGD